MPHPGAASHGVGVQAGNDGEGRAGVRVSPGRGAPRGPGSNRRRRRRQGRGGRLGRVRHPAERRFKQAATAEAGAGRAPRPSAASHGAGVQTGSNGRGRGGAGASAECGVSRGGGSNWRRGRPCVGGGGRVRRGGGPRPRRPGAEAGLPETTETPLACANTDSEGVGECPAHLHVASVTSGRASRAGIGPPRALAALIGPVMEDRGRSEKGEEGSGNRGGAAGGGMPESSRRKAPRPVTVGDRGGGVGPCGGCYSPVHVIGAAEQVRRPPRPVCADDPAWRTRPPHTGATGLASFFRRRSLRQRRAKR